MAAVASVSKLLVLAISHCSSMSIRLMNNWSGSEMMSSLSVSFSGTKLGHCERVSERITLDPGRWTNLMSYLDRRSDHRACRQLSFWALQKYVRFLWSTFHVEILGYSVAILGGLRSPIEVCDHRFHSSILLGRRSMI